MKLEDLPTHILQKVASYLPQQSKVNLMYSNYHFYSVIIPRLYEKLLITPSGLSTSQDSFRDSKYTTIGYLSTPLASLTLNNRVFASRQQVFLQSIQINPGLCNMIKEVIIYDPQGSRDIKSIIDSNLLEVLETNCPNIETFASLNTDPYEIIIPSLKRADLNKLASLELLLDLKVTELHISSENIPFDLHSLNKSKAISFFTNLDTLIINDELAQVMIIKYLLEIQRFIRYPFTTLKLIHYHSGNETTLECNKLSEQLLDSLDSTKLKNLELVIGCDDLLCSCFEDMSTVLKKKEFSLTALSIIQKTIQRDHNYSEKFDFSTTELLKTLPHSDKLKTLSIRHAYPLDFNCVGGFEGNYLHRIEMYKNILPVLTSLETLVAPTFMQSVACYEQLMSDLLWNNNCMCKECEDYTNIFDDYVQNHQYFSDYGGKFVDMFTSFLFGNVGKVMADRLVNDCDLFLLKYPKLIRYWDFHTGDHDVVHLNPEQTCGIDATAFDPLGVVVNHFLKGYVEEIKVLQKNIKHVLFSGFFYEISSKCSSD